MTHLWCVVEATLPASGEESDAFFVQEVLTSLRTDRDSVVHSVVQSVVGTGDTITETEHKYYDSTRLRLPPVHSQRCVHLCPRSHCPHVRFASEGVHILLSCICQHQHDFECNIILVGIPTSLIRIVRMRYRLRPPPAVHSMLLRRSQMFDYICSCLLQVPWWQSSALAHHHHTGYAGRIAANGIPR